MSSGQTERAIRTPAGKLVRLETDLPFHVVADIAHEHQVNWLQLVGLPDIGTGKALLDLYKACLAHVGEEPPAPLTVRIVNDALETVDDSLPEEYHDGAPKEDSPATT